jgi:hypothetical protein
MRLRNIVIATALLAPTALSAQIGGETLGRGLNGTPSRVGTRGANFLEIGVGGRALALAGAYAAAANDLSAVYWNVAGIADVQAASGFLSHEQLYGNSGLRNNFVAAALPFFGGVLGASFTSFTSGEILRTTEAWPDGGDPTFGSTVEWRASAVGLHYGRLFTDRLAFGATGKYASEGIQFANAEYWGADVGLRFRTGLYGTTLGAVVANLGTRGRVEGAAVRRAVAPLRQPAFPTQRTLDVDLNAGSNQLPTVLRFAVQTDLVGTAESALGRNTGFHRVSVFSDITDGVDTEIMPAFAAEYAFRERIAFRVGKRFTRDARTTGGRLHGFTTGAGVKIPVGSRRFLVDYAYRNFGDLESNHAFSFELSK